MEDLDRGLTAQPWIGTQHPGFDGCWTHARLQYLGDQKQVDEPPVRGIVRFTLAACIATNRFWMSIPEGKSNELLAQQVLQFRRDLFSVAIP
jgi:hypothetical protein